MRFKNKGSKKTNIIITIVALLQLVLFLGFMTYSWFESTTSLEATGDFPVEDKPYNGIILDKDSADSVSINNFFDVSMGDDFILSKASSANGTKIFLEDDSSLSTKTYTEGTSSDNNNNYLSCDFYVKTVAGSEGSLYFDEFTIEVYDKSGALVSGNAPGNIISTGTYKDLNKAVRVSITVDGVTKIFRLSSAGTLSAINTAAGGKATQTYLNSDLYMFNYNEDNDYDGRLSVMEANTTAKDVTFNMWIEGCDSNAAGILPGYKVRADITLVGAWGKPDTVEIYDRTTTATAKNFLYDGSYNVYYRLSGSGDAYTQLAKDTTSVDSKRWTGIVFTGAPLDFVVATSSPSASTAATFTTTVTPGGDEIYLISNFDEGNQKFTYTQDSVTELIFKDYTFGTTFFEDSTGNISLYYDDGNSNGNEVNMYKRTASGDWLGYIPTTAKNLYFKHITSKTLSSAWDYQWASENWDKNTQSTYKALGISNTTANYGSSVTYTNCVGTFDDVTSIEIVDISSGQLMFDGADVGISFTNTSGTYSDFYKVNMDYSKQVWSCYVPVNSSLTYQVKTYSSFAANTATSTITTAARGSSSKLNVSSATSSQWDNNVYRIIFTDGTAEGIATASQTVKCIIGTNTITMSEGKNARERIATVSASQLSAATSITFTIGSNSWTADIPSSTADVIFTAY